jgi:hypothetical protein
MTLTQHGIYGLTDADYAALLHRAAGVCEVCRIMPHKQIDHDHDTKLVRGLVCRSCNSDLYAVEMGWQMPNEVQARYLAMKPIGRGYRRTPTHNYVAPQDLVDRAKRIAHRRGETLSQVIRAALVRYVKRHEKDEP